MEVLISSSLGIIVLTSAFDVFVSLSNGMMAHTNAVAAQTEATAVLRCMVKELRLMNGPPTINASGDTITFSRVESSGYSSGGNTVSTLADSTQSWPVNAFAPTDSGAHSVKIILGAGGGEAHPIKSNSATTLTLADSHSWTVMPDTTSLYFIIRTKSFSLFPDRSLRYQVGDGPFTLLASNITDVAFSISGTDPNAVDVSLTAQSQTIDPRTGAYTLVIVNDTVRRRN